MEKPTKHNTSTQFAFTFYNEANGPESLTLTHKNITKADKKNFEQAKIEQK